MLRATFLLASVLLITGLDCAVTTEATTAATTVPTTAQTTPVPTTPKPITYELEKAENGKFRPFENKTEFKDFTFVHATDPQFGLIEAFRSNFTEQNVWTEEQTSLANAVIAWNKMQPAFVALTGDIVNAFPIDSERSNRTAQMEDFLKEINKLDKSIPLIILPGNHDLTDGIKKKDKDGNEIVHEHVLPKAIDEYKKMFGDNYYSFYVNNVKFIVLETQFIKDQENPDSKVKGLYEAQDKWLDAEIKDIKENNYTHTVVLQHIPYFLHNMSFVSKDTDWARIREKEAKPVLDKLEKAGIQHIFCGHYHQNVEEHYGNTTIHVTSAIGYQGDLSGNTKPGFNVVTVTKDDIKVQYEDIRAPEMPTTPKPTSSASSLIAFTSVFILLNMFVAFFSL